MSAATNELARIVRISKCSVGGAKPRRAGPEQGCNPRVFAASATIGLSGQPVGFVALRIWRRMHCPGPPQRALLPRLSGRAAPSIARPQVTPRSRLARWRVSTQAEGCVVDAVGGAVYVGGRETVGIWRFALDADGPGQLIVRSDGKQLVTDVEGLAIADEERRYSVASSQGDNAIRSTACRIIATGVASESARARRARPRRSTGSNV